MEQNDVKSLASTIFLILTPRVILVLFLFISLGLVSKLLTKNKVKGAAYGYYAYALYISKDLIVSLSDIIKEITRLILEPMIEQASKSGKSFDGIVSTYKVIYEYNVFYFLSLILFVVLLLILKPSSKNKEESSEDKKESTENNKESSEDKIESVEEKKANDNDKDESNAWNNDEKFESYNKNKESKK